MAMGRSDDGDRKHVSRFVDRSDDGSDEEIDAHDGSNRIIETAERYGVPQFFLCQICLAKGEDNEYNRGY